MVHRKQRLQSTDKQHTSHIGGTSMDPNNNETIPAGQGKAGLAPPRQNKPPGHVVHCVAEALRNEPAGQAVTQDERSDVATRPVAHAWHTLESF